VSAPSLGFPHDMLAVEQNRQSLAGRKLDQLDLPSVPVA